MKKCILITILCLSNNFVNAQPEVIWQLFTNGSIARWAYSGGDEFNGTGIDKSQWINSYPWGRNFSGTCNQEYMTDGLNYTVGNGMLKLIAKKETIYARGVPYETDDFLLTDGGQNLRWWDYTSGMLFSKKAYKYGLFEIRCKLPYGKGLWPAFWLYGGNPNEEFDIFEYKGETPNKIHYDMHCPGNSCKSVGGWVTANGNFSDGFNIFMGEWSPNASFWYLNWKEYAVWWGNLNYQANLIVNLGIANNSPCSFSPGPDNSTSFPAVFEIDYIRVWTRLDCQKTIVMNSYNQTLTDPTVLTGENINMGGIMLTNNQSLTLIATNEVIISNNSYINGDFEVKIVQCPGPTKNATYSNTIEEIDSVSLVPISIDSTLELHNNPIFYVKITPNTVDRTIFIEFEGTTDKDIKIDLLTYTGQIILTQNINSEKSINIDVSNLFEGIYYLVGNFGGNLISEKIILKNE